MLRLAFALLIAGAATAQDAAPDAPWAARIRPPDLERLEVYDASLGRALAQALARGEPADVALLVEGLRGPPGALDPVGEWRCRTMKLGWLTPLVVYRDFACRIEESSPNRWRLVKATGSQRLAGTLEAFDEGAIFLGVGHVGTTPAAEYEALPPEDQAPVEPNQTHAMVGRFEQMAPGRARLLLPAPLLESDFDILYLTR